MQVRQATGRELSEGKPFRGCAHINLFDPAFPRSRLREGHPFAFCTTGTTSIRHDGRDLTDRDERKPRMPVLGHWNLCQRLADKIGDEKSATDGNSLSPFRACCLSSLICVSASTRRQPREVGTSRSNKSSVDFPWCSPSAVRSLDQSAPDRRDAGVYRRQHKPERATGPAAARPATRGISSSPRT
jgi:hypothetical protein